MVMFISIGKNLRNLMFNTEAALLVFLRFQSGSTFYWGTIGSSPETVVISERHISLKMKYEGKRYFASIPCAGFDFLINFMTDDQISESWEV
jgi:hypothetical protein